MHELVVMSQHVGISVQITELAICPGLCRWMSKPIRQAYKEKLLA